MDKQLKHQPRRLRRFNNYLSLAIIGMSLYIIVMPLLPYIRLWLTTKTTVFQPPLVRAANEDNNDESIPKQNTIVIPALGMQQIIHEGSTEAALSQGIWRRPQTSSPDQAGNSVFAGHRFTYSDPAVFYHLDKLKPGDEIIVYWSGQKYSYVVDRSYITNPNDANVEATSDQKRLTLYTCTPLWTSKDRLVVTARPVEEEL